MNSKNFLKSNLAVFFIANSANLFVYLMQFVLSRSLSVEDFGILNSVRSLLTILVSVTQVLYLVVAKYIIEFSHDENQVALVVRGILRWLSLLGLIACLIIALLSGVAADYLKLPGLTPMYLMVGGLYTALFMAAFTGIMYGRQMFLTAEACNSLAFFLKMVFAVVATVVLAHSYNAVLLGILLANLMVALFMAWLLKGKVPIRRAAGASLPRRIHHKVLMATVPIGLTWFAKAILANMDIILVKHFCTAEVAGVYVVASLVGKIALFLPSQLTNILFSQVVQNVKDGTSSAGAVGVVMGLTGAFAGAFCLFLWFFPTFIITLLFGAKYAGAADVLVVIAAGMALLAISDVVFKFLLAKSKHWFLLPVYAGILGSIVAVYYFLHSTPLQVACGILGGISFIFFYSLTLLAWMFWTRQGRGNNTAQDSPALENN